MQKSGGAARLLSIGLGVLICGAAFCLITAPFPEDVREARFPAANEFSLAAASRITLHNSTAGTFRYLVKPLYENVPFEERVLKPGKTDWFTDRKQLEIRILPEDLSVIYWLLRGEHYSVRELEEVGPRIFKKVHGDSNILDLAPYVASPMSVVERMLEAAGVDRNAVVYDLGCGDGRVVITAAVKYGARGVGIDIDPARIGEARRNAREAGVEALVEFIQQDIFDTDLTDATVVYLYLYPDSNRILRPFLEERLKAGTIVACHSFSMPGWEDRLIAALEIPAEFEINNTLYIYRR